MTLFFFHIDPTFYSLNLECLWSNEEKTNDYENFEKGIIYMKILKKVGVVEKRGEEETKSMPHAPVKIIGILMMLEKYLLESEYVII
jgi:hypothetical protein